MKEYGSFDYCKKVLNQMSLDAREEVKKLGRRESMIKLLDMLKVEFD